MYNRDPKVRKTMALDTFAVMEQAHLVPMCQLITNSFIRIFT